jgi:hypothetical protein
MTPVAKHLPLHQVPLIVREVADETTSGIQRIDARCTWCPHRYSRFIWFMLGICVGFFLLITELLFLTNQQK